MEVTLFADTVSLWSLAAGSAASRPHSFRLRHRRRLVPAHAGRAFDARYRRFSFGAGCGNGTSRAATGTAAAAVHNNGFDTESTSGSW